MISPAPIQEALTLAEQKNKVNAPSWVQWLQSLVTAVNLLDTNKAKLTPEGGLEVKYTNKTGAASNRIQIYTSSAGTLAELNVTNSGTLWINGKYRAAL